MSSMPDLDFDIPWGFSDGACQGHPPICRVGVVLFMEQNHFIHPPICRVGVVLFMKQNHFIHIRYPSGRGTNNRAEFITLWTLLEMAMNKGVKKFTDFGRLQAGHRLVQK